MSKKFLARLAGGVALGSAALLLGTPAAAFASDEYGYDDSKDRDRGGVVCGNLVQDNEVFVGNFIVGNDVEDSEVEVEQEATADVTNAGAVQDVFCVGDVELDLEIED
ncbi:hypothetical protein ACSNN7_02575 [Micromonospora sp. URMC 105]|uniref:hypothetical protein n=1 Tax=Micromonospora sp. URMC 105 TaxID=3423413 RepID=UPI003F1BAAB1